MKNAKNLYIVNIFGIRNNDYGDAHRSLSRTDVLSAECKWDALKKTRKLAKKEAASHYLREVEGFFTDDGYQVEHLKSSWTWDSYATNGVAVTVTPFSIANEDDVC